MSTDQQIKEIVNFANVQLMRHDSAIVVVSKSDLPQREHALHSLLWKNWKIFKKRSNSRSLRKWSADGTLLMRNHRSFTMISTVHGYLMPNKSGPCPTGIDIESIWETQGLPKNVVAAIDDATNKILDHTSDPESEVQNFDKRGMVVGHVQSSKTTDYTGLICKAVDMGYRIVIVIAGLDNAPAEADTTSSQ